MKQVASKIFGLYLGKKYELILSESSDVKPRVEHSGNQLFVFVADVDHFMLSHDYLEKINDAFQSFLYKQSKSIIEKSVKRAQNHFKVKPKKIIIERSFKKWGSCNQDRILTFNFLLASKSIEVIDYVVLHEMCHILHLNHDRSFWRLLGSIMPHYKEIEAELKTD